MPKNQYRKTNLFHKGQTCLIQQEMGQSQIFDRVTKNQNTLKYKKVTVLSLSLSLSLIPYYLYKEETDV